MTDARSTQGHSKTHVIVGWKVTSDDELTLAYTTISREPRAGIEHAVSSCCDSIDVLVVDEEAANEAGTRFVKDAIWAARQARGTPDVEKHPDTKAVEYIILGFVSTGKRHPTIPNKSINKLVFEAERSSAPVDDAVLALESGSTRVSINATRWPPPAGNRPIHHQE